MKRIGISQEWVPADKRAAHAAAASAMVDREAVQSRMAESEARLQVTLAYLDAWFAEAASRLAVQTEHHLHEELAAARGRLAAAAGGSADVLQLTSATGMAEDESEEARQQQSSAFVALQRWVGFKPDAVTSMPAFDLPTEQDFVDRNPEVAGLRRDAEVARRNAVVAAKERTPNWTWQLAYGQRTGYSDMVSVGVSIPLRVAPAGRQDRETAARLALVDKADADLAEATRAATTDYRMLANDAERLQQRIARYRTSVITPAQQRTEVAMAAYRSNQGPLTALFEARHMEVETQRKLLALQRDLAKTQARLAFKPLAAFSRGSAQ
jgi:outer membrane protein TolC